MVDAVQEGSEGVLSRILQSDGFHKLMPACIRVSDDAITVAKT
jgi:hypothetical protein